MFSKAHVEKIQKASEVGITLDLFEEVEKMTKVEWVVSQDTYNMLISIGSIYDFNGDQRLIYNSMLIKLNIE